MLALYLSPVRCSRLLGAWLETWIIGRVLNPIAAGVHSLDYTVGGQDDSNLRLGEFRCKSTHFSVRLVRFPDVPPLRDSDRRIAIVVTTPE
jgi:hypothetical protein